MRLTADVLLRAEHYLNAWKERELNIRGLKIPAIENIAIVQDQFDCIDLSDNEIRKLGNFPPMTRLNTILANNNYISRIAKLGDTLKGITALVLTNNRIGNLAEIDNISTLTKLEHLSLLDNPVTLKSNYRLYVIHKVPTLKSLDYHKIKQVERDNAKKYFKSVLGKAMISDVSNEGKRQDASELNGSHEASGTATDHLDITSGSAPTIAIPLPPPPPGVPTSTPGSQSQPIALTAEQKKRVREAIESATTKEEIDMIEKRLKTGTFFELFEDDVDATAERNTPTTS